MGISCWGGHACCESAPGVGGVYILLPLDFPERCFSCGRAPGSQLVEYGSIPQSAVDASHEYCCLGSFCCPDSDGVWQCCDQPWFVLFRCHDSPVVRWCRSHFLADKAASSCLP